MARGSRSLPRERFTGARPVERLPNSSSITVLSFLRRVGRALLVFPRTVVWLLPFSWALLIFVLSSFTPNLEGFGLVRFGGFTTNLLHPGAFGLLALLIVPVFGRKVGPDDRRWTAMTSIGALWVIVIATLYGFTDELHQSTVVGRDASLLDLLSDSVGAFFSILVIGYLGREAATEKGLRIRLFIGLAASCAAAGAATAYSEFYGPGPWPF